MIKPITQTFLNVFFLIFSFTAVAGDDLTDFNQAKVINHNWSELSQDEYIENRMACEYKKQAHKWSKNIWPKENKKPKPDFEEKVDWGTISQQVHNNLKMQSVLSERFNIDITSAMLQHDLDRMAKNTKDPKGLKQLFKLFDNNPQTIAHCVSLPYLVQKKLQNSYNWNTEIHADTKRIAESELATFQKTKNADELSVESSTITFVIKGKENKESENIKHDQQVIELEEQEFIQKVKELETPLLRETEYGFVYQEVSSQSQEHIEINSLFWAKKSRNEWLPLLNYNFLISKHDTHKFKLPQIKTKSSKSEKFVLNESWDTREFLPTFRYNNSTIWTGSEMIVWGGENDGQFLNTGEKYNPVTDSWVEITTLSAPLARSYHTAVWTGAQMIIWGGNVSGIGNVNSGGGYNPSSDSWQAISTVNAPSARSSHTAIWTGDEMIIWGGGSYLNTGGRYDPQTDSWATITPSNAPIGRTNHTAVWSGNEMIIWGGYKFHGAPSYTNEFLNSGGKYNPGTDSWTSTNLSGAPFQRRYHSAVWAGNEMIIWGGHYINQSTGNHTFFSDGSKYNPSSNSWQAISTSGAPSPRNQHTAVWTGNEMIVWGGYYYSRFSGNFRFNTGGKYNPSSNTWISTSTLNAPFERSGHDAIWTGDEMIIWSSGTGGRYIPTADSWQDTASVNMPALRTGESSVWTGNYVITWGGYGSSGLLNSGEKYDPITDAFEQMNDMSAPTKRNGHGSVWTGSEMIVWGGYDGNSFTNSGGSYSPNTDSWMPISDINAPTGRNRHTTVWTGSEMVIWGGQGSLNTGGRYSPTTDMWQMTSSVNAPDGRYDHTAIWSGNEMIIWGGYGANRLQTGGRYDPTTDSWQGTDLTGAPSGRSGHSSIWTGSEMVVWGGYDGSQSQTGALYNPSTDSWQITSLTNAPTGRSRHSSIWTGNEMIVWGGYSGSYLNTGGIYDVGSNTWQEVTTVNAPSVRSGHAAIWTGNSMIIKGGGPRTQSFGVYSYETLFEISGNLSGLNGGQVTLQNNGGDNLVLSADGSFTFSTPLSDGTDYEVTVLTQPATSPNQTCTVSGGHDGDGSGTISSADVNNIVVTCNTTTYDVNVTVNGLATGNSVDVSNGGVTNAVSDVSNTTSFTLDDGTGYAVTTTNATTPNQTCSVTGGSNGDGSGTLNGADVAITITCVTNTYDVNVTVNGLAAGNSVDVSNGGITNAVSDVANTTSFTLDDGTGYAVTTTNATTPNQTCSVTGGSNGDGSGTLNGADVAITITCVTNTYDVNVTVNGLATGNSVDVSNGGVTNAVSDVTNTTSFTLDDGTGYAVTTTNATTPNQTCSVTGGTNGDGSGTLNGADVAISITCVTNQYSVGGNVSGLAAGNEVILQNNTGDDLTVSANGTFTFATLLDDESSYAVTVLSQPTSPNQTCVITGGTNGDGTGTLAGANETGIIVTCETDQYSVGGTVSGLASGNDVVLKNNSTDDLTVSADGSFVFDTQLDDESSYAVTVLTNPTTPNQTCSVSGGTNGDGTGVLAGNDDTSIVVTCETNQYSVGGNVSGLASGNDVVLQNNAGDDLSVLADGSFTFATLLDDESNYAVSVATQPSSPNQQCTVTQGTGTLAGANITDIQVNCVTDVHSIGGTVTGLANNNFVTLSMNAGDEYLVVNSNSSFTFLNSLADGSAYEVSVLSNPTTPNQSCTLTNGSGNLQGADITDIEVECTINQYYIGGYINGLIPDNYMVLQNNLTDDLMITNQGAFAFPTPLDDQQSYDVTIQTQPNDPIQSCEVINGDGSLTGSDVENIFVACEFGDDLIYRHGFDTPEAISRALWEPEE